MKEIKILLTVYRMQGLQPNAVLEWLYLGTKYNAFNREWRKQVDVDYVLNVVGGAVEDDNRFVIVPLCDYGRTNLAHKLPKCFKFLGNFSMG